MKEIQEGQGSENPSTVRDERGDSRVPNRIVIADDQSYLGRKTLELLRDSVDLPVRVITKDGSSVARRFPDFEIVEASLADHRTFEIAFSEVDAVFWCPSYLPEQRGMVNEAIRSANISRVVVATADEWKENGGKPRAAWRVLRHGFLMENLLDQWDLILEQGYFSYPIDGNLNLPLICALDVAKVAVELLMDSTWTGTGTLTLHGPHRLGFFEMADTLSDALKKPIAFEEASRRAYQNMLFSRGVHPDLVQAEISKMPSKNSVNAKHISLPTSFQEWLLRV